MLPTFIIGLREGLEAALIVGIVAAFLAQQGRKDALRQVWLGTALAVGICVAVGVLLQIISADLPQRGQERLETVVGVVAVAMVTYMVVWMRSHAKDLKGDLERSTASALAQNSTKALVLMAFLAVMREGFETVVFLLAAFHASGHGTASGTGALLGILLAVIGGYAIYKGGLRVHLQRFFRVTGLVLVVIAAGLVMTAFHTGNEGGCISVGQQQMFDLTWFVRPGSVVSSLVTGVLGIQPFPNQIEVFAWLVYLVPMVPWCAGPRAGQAQGRARAGAGFLAVVAAGALLTACGSSSKPATGPSTTTQAGTTAAKGTKVVIALTSDGCTPSPRIVNAGTIEFDIENKDAAAVSEAELKSEDLSHIYAEKDKRVTPGLSASFTVKLAVGPYRSTARVRSRTRGTSRSTTTVRSATGTTSIPQLVAATHGYQAWVKSEVAQLVTHTTTFVVAVEAGQVDQAKELYAQALPGTKP